MNGTRPLIAVALALASLPGVAAHAQGQPNDARCLLVSNLFLKSADDPKAKDTAMRASFFYLGRVTGSAAEVKARLIAEAKTLTAENSGPAMAACANAMVARAEQLSGPPPAGSGAPQGR